VACAWKLQVFLVALISLSGGHAVQALPVKLNGSLATGGNVDPDFRFSPDGSRVIYVADQNARQVFELFSVPAVGGTPVRLNGSLVAAGNVLAGSGRFGAGGGRVIYVADQQTNEMFELYSVPSAGGTALTLNQPMVPIGDVDPQFQISPDGQRVLYVANPSTNPQFEAIFELFSVPSVGGTPVKLNGDLVPSGDVVAGSGRFSPNGSRVVYLADQQTDGMVELFSVSSGGGEAVKLNGPLSAIGDVMEDGLQFSPDGNRVLYAASARTDLQFRSITELFVVPALGGTPLTLNGPLVSGGNVLAASARFSPDGSRAVYVADQDADEVFELFSVPVTGGTPQKLNGPLTSGGDVSTVALQFSPDGSRVLYVADQNVDERFELFTVPAVGGDALALGGDGSVDPYNVWCTPDGNRVVYRASPLSDDGYQLYSVLATGGVPVLLNGELVSGGNVIGAQLSPDGSRIVYLADQDIDEVFELYVVPITGGMPQKLNGPLPGNRDVTHWQISPNGQRVVYRADQDVDEQFELYSVELDLSLPGDYNADGRVDAGDYVRWRNHLGDTDEGAINFNGDGEGVSLADYTWWKQHYNSPGAGSGGLVHLASRDLPVVGHPVPEPSGFLLIAAALNLASPGRPAGRGRIAR